MIDQTALRYLELIKLKLDHRMLVSVIANFVSPVAEEITQSADQVKMKLISQPIKGISRVLQKILRYFNGTAVLTSCLLPGAGVFPVILILNLSNSDSTILSFVSSL